MPSRVKGLINAATSSPWSAETRPTRRVTSWEATLREELNAREVQKCRREVVGIAVGLPVHHDDFSRRMSRILNLEPTDHSNHGISTGPVEVSEHFSDVVSVSSVVRASGVALVLNVLRCSLSQMAISVHFASPKFEMT